MAEDVPSRLRRVVFVLLVLGAAAEARAFSFTPIGDLEGGEIISNAEAVSADGTTVVGWSDSTDGDAAVVWRADTGIQALPWLLSNARSARAYAVSDDGTVIAGTSAQLMATGGASSTLVTEAVRWTHSSATVQGLGLHPDPQPTNEPLSWTEGRAISGDGSIVGGINFPIGAILWTEASGLESLYRPGPDPLTSLFDMTPDGGTIVGQAITNDPAVVPPAQTQIFSAFRQIGDGAPVMLGVFDGGTDSSATAVSSDGRVVVGGAGASSGRLAFRWTETDGLVALEDARGTAVDGHANGVSADGRVIVGTTNGQEAFVWTSAEGARSLATILQTAGIDLAGWQLQRATDVSADGRVVVGSGINPSGHVEGFVAVIPEPRTALLLGLGLSLLSRRRR